MSVQRAYSAPSPVEASRLVAVGARRAPAEKAGERGGPAPARLSRRLEALSYVASPFRLSGVERLALGSRGADETALHLARIGGALDEAIAGCGDPEQSQALSLGRSLVGEIAERFVLAGATGTAEGDGR